jgi:hypothetical protein
MTDKCHIPTKKYSEYEKMIAQSILSPTIIFSADTFVKVYYDIMSLEDMLKWLDDNRRKPYQTKKRILDNGMVTYGNDLNIIDHRLVNHIDDVMNYNLDKIYDNVKFYFKIKDNKVKISIKQDSINHSSKEIHNIKNYIKKHFFGNDNINSFLSKFIRYYKDNLTKDNITDNIVKYMIEYMVKKINHNYKKI